MHFSIQFVDWSPTGLDAMLHECVDPLYQVVGKTEHLFAHPVRAQAVPGFLMAVQFWTTSRS